MSANVALCTCNIEQLIIKVEVIIKDDKKSKRRKKQQQQKRAERKRKGGRQKPMCLTGITRRFPLFSVFMCI
jgi:hypothetical protein